MNFKSDALLRLAEYENNMGIAANDLEDMNKELADIMKENEEAQDRIEELERLLALRDKDIKEKTSRITELEEELESLKRNFGVSGKEMNSAKSRISQLEEELADKDEEL